MPHPCGPPINITPSTAAFRRPRFSLIEPLEESDDIKSVIDLLEFNARYNGDHLCCLQNQRSSEKFQNITFAGLKQAVERCAAWMCSTIKEIEVPILQGGELIKGPPVALLMSSDIKLWIYILSLMYIGTPVSKETPPTPVCISELTSLRRYYFLRGLI